MENIVRMGIQGSCLRSPGGVQGQSHGGGWGGLLAPQSSWVFDTFNPFASEAVYTRNFFFDRLSDSIPFFESFAGSRVNTPLVAVTNVGWRVYTPVFLGVRGNTLRCPRTKGTAVSEWVHSFVDFCLIPLSTTCSVVFDASPELRLFDRVRADNRPVLRSLQRY